MSSTGQIVGGVVGAVVGFFTPAGPVIGAQIGMMAGGYLDPPKGQHTYGPRLSDRKVQFASYGYQLPRLYGTIKTAGCVIWVENDEYTEHANDTTQGGKGGPTATNTAYTYSVTFGVALAHCPTKAIAGVRRMWIGGQLVYDAGSDNLESIIASNLQQELQWKFYDGRDDQQPDPRWQADKGVDSVSGLPGICWIALYDLDLSERLSNSLAAAQVEVEIVSESVGVDCDPLLTLNADVANNEPVNVLMSGSQVRYVREERNDFYGNLEAVEFYTAAYYDYHRLDSSVATGFGHDVTSPCIRIAQSRSPCALVQHGATVPGTSSTLSLYNQAGLVTQSEVISSGTFPFVTGGVKIAAIDEDEGHWFIGSHSGLAVYKFINGAVVAQTAATYGLSGIGYSGSFVFGVKRETSVVASTITIYKWDRDDMSLLATWTATAPAQYVTLQVVDDDTLYTGSSIDGHVLKWVNGSVVNDLGALLQPDASGPGNDLIPRWFSVITESPPFAATMSNDVDNDSQVFIGHANNPATAVKLRDLITDECALANLESGDLSLATLTNSDVRGYSCPGGTVRSGLEPLQAPFPFDVIHSGYRVKFVSRGGASVANIPEADLGAVSSGDKAPFLLRDVREMSEQLPSSTTVLYLDSSREYDVGEQTMYQPGMTGISERRVELALVLTADEAAQTADRLNKLARAERSDLAFTLPPIWRHLEPADVVTLNHRGRSIEALLTRVEYLPDGRLECQAKPTSTAAYTSTASGSDPLVLGQSLVPMRGSSVGILLDIPMLDSHQNSFGISAAMYGAASGWPGGVLLRSDDNGASWSSQTGFLNRSEVFTATTVLGAGRTDMVDFSSAVTVTPNWSAADLFSITRAQLFAHGNIAAFGAPGRWEIIAFQTVTDNTGSYTLRNFLRGIAGTERNTGNHAIGDVLVMLDATQAKFIGLPSTALNSPRLWRAVTNGAALDTGENTSVTCEGASVKPLSPVRVNGSRHPSTFDWSVKWQFRSRSPVEPFSGVDMPIGETSELYKAELWDSGYTTLIRSYTGLTSPEFTYTRDEQEADGGLPLPDTLYLRIYMRSSLIGDGYPLETSIYRYIDVVIDAYRDAVLALNPLLYYRLDESSGTSIADASPSNNTATAGSSGITYGQTSMLTSGMGSSITCAAGARIRCPRLAAMDGAYSATFIIKFASSLTTLNTIYHKGESGGATSNYGHYVYFDTARKLTIAHYNGSWLTKATTAAVVAVGEQAHIVVVYDGATNFKVYKNGTLFESLTMASAVISNAKDLVLLSTVTATPTYGNTYLHQIDEFAWFTAQLTGTQITALYAEA